MTPAVPGQGPFELTLFISGASERSARAIESTRHLLGEHLPGRHRLTIVDVNDDPDGALDRHVFAVPTLLKTLPLPARRVVGDLAASAKVLEALGLPPARAPGGAARRAA